jgi:ACS family glucarate transporter-like MFS transporter
MNPLRFGIVVGTFLLAMLLYVDRILISVAKTDVGTALSLTDKQMGWALSIFSLGYALFQMPAGAAVDRYGARRILALIVTIWSFLTVITGWAWNFFSLLVIRFLFGAGEAGAYPGINRVVFSWIPMRERGTVNGINFSAGRLGAAFALPMLAWLIQSVGWRESFGILGGVGLVWALGWYLWFRNEPTEHKSMTNNELDFILKNRQQPTFANYEKLPLSKLTQSRNMILLASQYFASNFTFFFCLTWLFPHLKMRFQLDAVEAGFYAAVPLVFGALGNLVAGRMVDSLYRQKRFSASRRMTAMVGFAIAAVGLLMSTFAQGITEAVVFLSMAVFGADMTLSPSWATCSDIGGSHSGMVSGAMNMVGNIGAFLTALAFPYLQAWTGSNEPFFYLGTFLNLLAVLMWLRIEPTKVLNERQDNTKKEPISGIKL